MIDKTGLKQQLLSGMNCAQCVFGAFAERFDYAPEEFHRFGAGFGGGMHRGETCGAVIGGILALGAAFGDDMELTTAKVKRFQDAFSARYGSLLCRELVGYDFSVPAEYAAAKECGITAKRCPDFVTGAAEIVEALFDE